MPDPNRPPDTSFLRPEVRAALTRWREVIAAVAVIGLGLWIAARPGPIVQGFGYVLAIAGALAVVPALRRARFASGGQGPGVVQIDEGRILYMGPITGGTIAIREMTALSLRTDHLGHKAWVLTEPGQLLVIPDGAAGADALFDAFTTLPGLAPRHLLAARESAGEETQTVWRRDPAPALTP